MYNNNSLVGQSLLLSDTTGIIAAGKVIDEKVVAGPNNKHCVLVSFDREFYFNLEHSEIHCDKLDYLSRKELHLNHINILPYRDYPDNPNEICYKENTARELDEGVKKLVAVMNKLEGVATTGSCDGHDIEHLYIEFYCNNINILNILTSLLNGNGNFSEKFVLRTEVRLYPDTSKGPMFLLESTNMQRQIENANQLAIQLQEVIVGYENE